MLKLLFPAAKACRLPFWQFHVMLELTPVLNWSLVVKPAALVAVMERV
jgi:hypothetical protein